MKIDNSGKLQGSYGAQGKSAARDSKAPAVSAPKDESVSINPLASRIGEVERQIGSEPAFDAAKVDAIKSAIASGTFSVNPGKIADGLISSARELLGR